MKKDVCRDAEPCTCVVVLLAIGGGLKFSVPLPGVSGLAIRGPRLSTIYRLFKPSLEARSQRSTRPQEIAHTDCGSATQRSRRNSLDRPNVYGNRRERAIH